MVLYDSKTGKFIASTSGNASVKSSSSRSSSSSGTVYNPAIGIGTRFVSGYDSEGNPIGYGYAGPGITVTQGRKSSGGRQIVTGTRGSYIPGVSQEGTINTPEGEKVAVKASEMRQEAREERERLLRQTYKLTESQRTELENIRRTEAIQSKPREVYVSGEDVNRVNRQFSEAGIQNAEELFRLVREGKAEVTDQGIVIKEEAQTQTQPSVWGAVPEGQSFFFNTEPTAIGGVDLFTARLNRLAQEKAIEAKTSDSWRSAVLYQQSGALSALAGLIEGPTGVIKAVKSGDPATIFFLGASALENVPILGPGARLLKAGIGAATTGAGLYYGKEALEYIGEAETSTEATRRIFQGVGSIGTFYAIGKGTQRVAIENPLPTKANLKAVEGSIQWDTVMSEAQTRTGSPWGPPVITETMKFITTEGDILVPGGSIKGGFAVETRPGLRGEIQTQIVEKPYSPPLAIDWLTPNPKAPPPSEIFSPERLNYLQNYQLQDYGIRGEISTELRRATLPSEVKTEPYQQSLKDYELKINEAGRYIGPGLPAKGVSEKPVLITETPVFPKAEIKLKGIYGKKGSATIIETGKGGTFERVKGVLDEIRIEYTPPVIERPKPGISSGSGSEGFTGAIRIFSPREEERENIYITSKPSSSRRFVPTSIGRESIIPREETEPIVYVTPKPSTGTTPAITPSTIAEPIITPEIRRQSEIFRPPRPEQYTRPRTPPEYTTPPPPIFRTGGKPSGGGMFEPGFNVLVRQKGVFKQINFEPLSRAGAFSTGIGITGSTALASFKVVPSGTTVKKKSMFDSVDLSGYYQRNGVFIEKPSFRINTPGELREITYKGLTTLSKRRGRSIFG